MAYVDVNERRENFREWYKKTKKKYNNPLSHAREKKDEIIELYKSGKSTYEIAIIYDVYPKSISRLLHENLVPLRTYSESVDNSREKNKRWSGFGIITGTVWSQIRGGATARNLEFSITKEEALEILEKQNYKCALSGIELILPTTCKEAAHAFRTASLDRIDSSKGYTKENCQWVNFNINIMKWSNSDEVFYNWCKLVYLNLKEKYEK